MLAGYGYHYHYHIYLQYNIMNDIQHHYTILQNTLPDMTDFSIVCDVVLKNNLIVNLYVMLLTIG